MNKNVIIAIFGAVLCLLSSAQAVADITMGIFPRRPIAVTHKAFKPLAEHLSRQLGEPVHLVIPKSFKAFWKGVEQKKFDLVHFNQYHYIKSHKEYGYKVIVANEEFGNKQIAGALSVRKDSGIRSVKDLKGKTILFGGGRKAMGSYIAPTAILKTAGLVADRDYKVNFAKNPPSAVIGVYNNAAQASGSGNVILRINAVTKKINANDVKILAESEPYAQLPWAVKGTMPEAKANKIRDAMINLKKSPEGQAILKNAKVTAFYAVNDDDYAKVREITKFAIGEEY
ncbi:MAG: phosphate/phosphite/phosphonate ABC transporter substrate-binding protein [Gammaproteobacteria bacterium]|jgi:phosphonate transport system substrate-binding protein